MLLATALPLAAKSLNSKP